MLSGLLVLVAMVRNGINIFWASLPDGEVVQLRRVEIGPIVGLLTLCVLLSLMGGPVMAFFLETANTIHMPGAYIDAVLAGSTLR